MSNFHLNFKGQGSCLGAEHPGSSFVSSSQINKPVLGCWRIANKIRKNTKHIYLEMCSRNLLHSHKYRLFDSLLTPILSQQYVPMLILLCQPENNDTGHQEVHPF